MPFTRLLAILGANMQTIEELQKRNGVLEFQNHQLHEYMRSYIDLYYDLLKVSLDNSALAVNFDPNKIVDFERHYRMTESQYKTFQGWSDLIREFNETSNQNR